MRRTVTVTATEITEAVTTQPHTRGFVQTVILFHTTMMLLRPFFISVVFDCVIKKLNDAKMFKF